MTLAPTSMESGKRRSRGFHVIRWVEANCVFTNGEWIGKPFRLLPWERQLILELFEVRPDGLRRYRWAYIQVAKKNGKTELAAALALYFLIGDGEPSPLVVCAAASDEQADLVFGAARTMCTMSPTLSLITEVFEREILVPSIPGAKLKRVAATAGTNDGQNIHAVICDELHEWTGNKGESVWNVLTNGTGVRKQPMVLQTTTAGYDLETVCGRQYQYAKAIERGEIKDARYYAFIREAAEGCDLDDRDAWLAANPSFGVTVTEDFMLDQLPPRKKESVFRRYFLDQWVEAEEFWLPVGSWDACNRGSGARFDPKKPIAVGIDIGVTHDACAVVMGQFDLAADLLKVRARFWINPYPRDHSLHDQWRVDLTEVRAFLVSLRKDYPASFTKIDGRAVAGPGYFYDPYAFRESAQMLEEEGLAMVEVPQNATRLVPAARSLFELVVNRRLAHDGDQILAHHIRNVVAEPRGDNGWWLTKPKGSSKHIDGARALLNLLTEALEAPPPPRVGAFLA